MPSRHLTILTGASRGLGRAIAKQRLQPGHQLLTLSRHPCDLIAPAGAEHIAWSQDLAASVEAAERLERWLDTQSAEAMAGTVASATIIHNAGVLSRLAPLADNDAADLAHALRVGLEAPMLLTAAFLRATADWPVPRKVLLISSGLGRRPMAGSASYCAAKAGLDHLARALALEEAARPNGARVVSLAPGVIDTDMQVQLRTADPTHFAARASFVGLHESGQLVSPAEGARRVLAYLDRPGFGQNPIGDVRDPA